MKNTLSQLLHEHPSTAWVSVASISMFVASLVLVPWLVVRLPADYFVRDHERRGPLWASVLRNLAGAILLALGILMLALPGPGMLTLLTGLMLIDIPGKRGLVRRAASLPNVRSTLNRFRRRFNRPPFAFDDG